MRERDGKGRREGERDGGGREGGRGVVALSDIPRSQAHPRQAHDGKCPSRLSSKYCMRADLEPSSEQRERETCTLARNGADYIIPSERLNDFQ